MVCQNLQLLANLATKLEAKAEAWTLEAEAWTAEVWTLNAEPGPSRPRPQFLASRPRQGLET